MLITIRNVTNGWVVNVSYERDPSLIDTYVFNIIEDMCAWLTELYALEVEEDANI